jgi:hypothetical protein
MGGVMPSVLAACAVDPVGSRSAVGSSHRL